MTNLNDRGEGSLRTAIEASEPPTVVFRISETIVLESPLTIKHPNITIAGQTTPGDFICLKGETLRILTHDVIIRYIRIRLGDGRYGVGSKQGRNHDYLIQRIELCQAFYPYGQEYQYLNKQKEP